MVGTLGDDVSGMWACRTPRELATEYTSRQSIPASRLDGFCYDGNGRIPMPPQSPELGGDASQGFR